MEDRHWATRPTEELAAAVRELATRYWEEVTELGLVELWQRSERTYYGLDDRGGWKSSCAVEFSGADLEHATPRINQYRSLGQAKLAVAGLERPRFVAQALDSKTSSLTEAPKATGIVDEFWRRWQLEAKTNKDDECALVYGASFQHLRWSPHVGRVLPPEMQPPTDGLPLREGDIIAESVPPWRVVYDPKSIEDMKWACVAHEESAYELAARYPQFGEAILAQRGSATHRWVSRVWGKPWEDAATTTAANTSNVTVWCVYHRPCDMLPQGRYAVVCGDIVLADGPAYLEDRLPVIPLVESIRLGQDTAYSTQWDLLVLQELYDAGWSAIATAHDAFGGQNILVSEASGISDDDLGGTRRAIKWRPDPTLPDGGRPQAIQLLSLPSESYRYPDDIKREMQVISGINSVARGEPDANLKSGAALALVQSMSVQSVSAFAARRTQHRERIAETGYHLVKKLSVLPQPARVLGAGNGSYLREIPPEEMEAIQSISIDIGSAIMAQAAGRFEVADKLLDRGLIPTPEQYLRILETGRIEPLLKSPSAELMQIDRENDALREGKRLGPPLPPPGPPGAPMPDGMWEGVAPTDTHEIHVREHRALLDFATRQDPAKAAAISAHITAHYKSWAATPPDMAALLGWKVMPPPPPPPPGMPMPGPEGQPPGPPPSPGGPPPGPDGPPPAERVSVAGKPPSQDMPMMPKNPLTGERAPTP